MDDWEKFNETSLSVKQDWYSYLNMDDITDANYGHAKKVCKDLEIKSLGECHNLNAESNKSLLADVFVNVSWKIWTWSCKISSSSALERQAALNKTKVKWELSTDIYMLLIVAKGKRRGIFDPIYWHAKTNSK